MLLVFFGLLAGLAVFATWRDSDLRPIGLALAAGFAVSNALHFLAPVVARPGPYTMIEMTIALFAYCAWGVHGGRKLIALVCVNLISVAFNINFALEGFEPSSSAAYIFVLGTNLCFVVECLLALSVGIAHGACRFRWRLPVRRPSAQRHAAREGGA
jgi:NADH:ubiquinone oxidoreductase subunit K